MAQAEYSPVAQDDLQKKVEKAELKGQVKKMCNNEMEMEMQRDKQQ
jgi:hypothetical protein